MTVAEMIEKLQKMPQDLTVTFWGWDDYQDECEFWSEFNEVKLAPDQKSVQVGYQQSLAVEVLTLLQPNFPS